jgi:CheY-like chemotaxis protein
MLLVDDNWLVLISLEGILVAGGNGWKTVRATDGLAALAELDRQSFDLIVTDYQMPGMNGLKLVQAVQQKRPGTPVIMLTGYDSRELREQARDLDVFRTLEKPVPGHLFLKAVSEASRGDCYE